MSDECFVTICFQQYSANAQGGMDDARIPGQGKDKIAALIEEAKAI